MKVQSAFSSTKLSLNTRASNAQTARQGGHFVLEPQLQVLICEALKIPEKRIMGDHKAFKGQMLALMGGLDKNAQSTIEFDFEDVYIQIKPKQSLPAKITRAKYAIEYQWDAFKWNVEQAFKGERPSWLDGSKPLNLQLKDLWASERAKEMPVWSSLKRFFGVVDSREVDTTKEMSWPLKLPSQRFHITLRADQTIVDSKSFNGTPVTKPDIQVEEDMDSMFMVWLVQLIEQNEKASLQFEEARHKFERLYNSLKGPSLNSGQDQASFTANQNKELVTKAARIRHLENSLSYNIDEPLVSVEAKQEEGDSRVADELSLPELIQRVRDMEADGCYEPYFTYTPCQIDREDFDDGGEFTPPRIPSPSPPSLGA
ncbi:MAG: hypothetical protein ACK551_06375 [Vampirovibrionales bacterium]